MTETNSAPQKLDIGAEVKKAMAEASPEAKQVIAEVFGIEKEFLGMSRTSQRLLAAIEKSVRRTVDKASE